VRRSGRPHARAVTMELVVGSRVVRNPAGVSRNHVASDAGFTWGGWDRLT
jgi:hypothetical protein